MRPTSEYPNTPLPLLRDATAAIAACAHICSSRGQSPGTRVGHSSASPTAVLTTRHISTRLESPSPSACSAQPRKTQDEVSYPLWWKGMDTDVMQTHPNSPLIHCLRKKPFSSPAPRYPTAHSHCKLSSIKGSHKD